jgi:hypothetical protein
MLFRLEQDTAPGQTRTINKTFVPHISAMNEKNGDVCVLRCLKVQRYRHQCRDEQGVAQPDKPLPGSLY